MTSWPYQDKKDAAGYDWRVDVELDIAKEFVHEGARLEDLNVPSSRNNVCVGIKRRSHVRVSSEEFDAAVAMLS